MVSVARCSEVFVGTVGEIHDDGRQRGDEAESIGVVPSTAGSMWEADPVVDMGTAEARHQGVEAGDGAEGLPSKK